MVEVLLISVGHCLVTQDIGSYILRDGHCVTAVSAEVHCASFSDVSPVPFTAHPCAAMMCLGDYNRLSIKILHVYI